MKQVESPPELESAETANLNNNRYDESKKSTKRQSPDPRNYNFDSVPARP